MVGGVLHGRVGPGENRRGGEQSGEVADEFDTTHDIRRAQRVGSVDRIVNGGDLRPYIVDALERGMAEFLVPSGSGPAAPSTAPAPAQP